MHNEFNGHALSNVKARLHAFVSDADYMKLDPSLKTKLFWALEINAEWEDEDQDQDKTNWEEEDYDQTYWQSVGLLHEVLTFPDEIRSWKMLVGQTVHWVDPYYTGIDGSRPLFQVTYCQDVETGTISFLECEGDKVRVTWSGTTDGCGEFSVDVWAVFEKVEISHRVAEGEEVADVLARHLNSDDFDEEPSAQPSQTYTRFKPKLEVAE